MSNEIRTHSKTEIYDTEILKEIDALDLRVGSREDYKGSKQKSSQHKQELEKCEIIRINLQVLPEHTPLVVEDWKINIIAHLLELVEDDVGRLCEEPNQYQDRKD